MRTDQDFVVCNGRFEFQKELLVLGIINGLFVLRAGECFDGVEGVPQREDDKLSFAVLDSSQ